MSNTNRQSAAASYKANLEALNVKYQAAIPAARKYAYSLTTQELMSQLAENGISHVSDLIHNIARKQAIA
jgi:tRNA A37 threonylcarbamoyladenosine dehydratase